MSIYLDANASEPARPAALAAAAAAMALGGNPASVHGAGRAARRVLDDAREAIAARFGASPADLVFTSGGTEADALAIHAMGANRRLVIGATEHDAVRAAAEGALVIAVDGNGLVDLDHLARLLQGPPASRPALVCLMLANNETGTIQPIAAAAALCHAAGALLHVDAVQAAGRIPVDINALGADSIAISGHKFGGIPGAGALLLAPGRDVGPLISGGGQERGRRGGTPALPAIAAMAAAVNDTAPDLSTLRDELEAAARGAGAIAIAGGAPRLSNTACLALPGVAAERQVIALDLAGFAVSAGAACSSGKVARSHVLDAMGLGPLAGQAIRISLPWNVVAADVAAFSQAYAVMAGRMQKVAA